MIKVDNKVIFLKKASGGINRESQLSSNVQGTLKKKVTKVKKIKTSEDIKVTITGTYKEYKIEVEPKGNKLESKIIGMLKKRD